MDFSDFFRRATGFPPYPYQERLAAGAPAVLDAATGLGKTEATVLAWLYRLTNNPNATPRRLIYCLPMRSLVEQTRDRIASCFAALEPTGAAVPRIDTVMGGDVGEEWFRKPELPCVVVGTQDMLLSRALNRGYTMSRFQWPMTFAAANDDAYWVVDEVQLQGIGAVTAAQLQSFRERFGTFHRTEITLASATIDESWFDTADFSLADRPRVSLDEHDLANPGVRRIVSAKKRIERSVAYEPNEVAALARERHRPGTRTLIVLNRVRRAQDVYRALKRDACGAELVLLHSRFRPEDRAEHAKALLAEVDPSGPGRIVVATQVVEAGVDVSAATLITDVAPWASLVQRFGRCNRRGDDADAMCLWLDAGEVKKNDAGPYDPEDLAAARALLAEREGASAAPADLPNRPIPLRTGLVIRKPELFDLFDTSADLAGHDVDVSPYIRDAEDVSVSVFWRDEPPDATETPLREELCSAPVSALRVLSKMAREAGHGSDVRVANQFAKDTGKAWTELHNSEIRPGLIVWLRSDVGWYDPELGFGKVQRAVPPVSRSQQAREYSENCPTVDSDQLSLLGTAVPLSRHAQDTQRCAREIAAAVALDGMYSSAVATAALWHDAGKAHPVFQETMRRANTGIGDGSEFWAKGVRRAMHTRRGFRHELPGALAYLHAHEGEPVADVIAYLIAAHHGKLRVSAQQFPYEASCEPFQLLGNREGETLPDVDLGGSVIAPTITLGLESFKVATTNGGRTWIDRTTSLRDDPSLGPFRLAYMELLVRLSDWRASEEEAR